MRVMNSDMPIRRISGVVSWKSKVVEVICSEKSRPPRYRLMPTIKMTANISPIDALAAIFPMTIWVRFTGSVSSVSSVLFSFSSAIDDMTVPADAAMMIMIIMDIIMDCWVSMPVIAPGDKPLNSMSL